MTLTVSLQVWRQHCSPLPPKNRVFSEAKTFESWSLATPRSKSLAVLSLCHNSTSRGNLKQSDFSVRHQHERGSIPIHLGKRPHVLKVTSQISDGHNCHTTRWVYCLSLTEEWDWLTLYLLHHLLTLVRLSFLSPIIRKNNAAVTATDWIILTDQDHLHL